MDIIVPQLPGLEVGAIIGKLLAKDPDDRYQSAAGLLADLRRCAELEQSLQASGKVELGTKRALEEGLRSNLIEAGKVGYSFVHDRVFEALALTVAESERAAIHQRLAEAFEKRGGETTAQSFGLARHFAKGLRQENFRKIVDYNLRAGKHAFEISSFPEAYEFLSQSFGVTKEFHIETPADEIGQLHELLGAVCGHVGRMEEAHLHLPEARKLASGELEQARLIHAIAKTYASESKFDEAWSLLLEAFGILGKPIPKSKLLNAPRFLADFTIAALVMFLGAGYGKARGEEQARRKVLAELNHAGRYLSWFTARPLALAVLIAADARNCHRLGASPENSRALTWLSLFWSVASASRRISVHYMKRAVAIARQLGNPETFYYTTFIDSVMRECVNDVAVSQRIANENACTSA